MNSRIIRAELAYAYRIIAELQMDDHTYTHLSARIDSQDEYYIFPFGLRFEEVTPDSLLKMSMYKDKNVLEEYQHNQTAYAIHGSIYNNRPDVNVIFHLHTPATVAVSAMKRGLLPLSQWALHFYNQVSYYNYNSLVIDEETQGMEMAHALSKKNILFLRNHGFIVCAKYIREALFYCYHLEQACKTQIMALAANEELIVPNDMICEKANTELLTFETNLGERDWQAWVRKINNKYQLNF